MAQLVKTMAGLAIASVKTVNDLAIASVKTVAGLDNTSGGVPTGNAFTFVNQAQNAANNIPTMPTTAAGDLVVCMLKWENTGTFTNFSVTSGETITIGTAIDNPGSSGEPHVRMGYFIATGTGGGIMSLTGTSGSIDFPGMWAMAFRKAGGTIALDTEASGADTTGQDPATGTFTTATVNGLTVAMQAEYGGNPLSQQKVGGNNATGTLACDNSTAFYYLNTAQLSGATASTHQNSSNRWTMKSLSFKAT